MLVTDRVRNKNSGQHSAAKSSGFAFHIYLVFSEICINSKYRYKHMFLPWTCVEKGAPFKQTKRLRQDCSAVCGAWGHQHISKGRRKHKIGMHIYTYIYCLLCIAYYLLLWRAIAWCSMNATLCYAAPCCTMLSDATLSHTMLYYAMLCYMLCYMICYVPRYMLWYMPCYAMLCRQIPTITCPQALVSRYGSIA